MDIRKELEKEGWSNLNGKSISYDGKINTMGIGISLDAEDYDLTDKQDQDALVEYLNDVIN